MIDKKITMETAEGSKKLTSTVKLFDELKIEWEALAISAAERGVESSPAPQAKRRRRAA